VSVIAVYSPSAEEGVDGWEEGEKATALKNENAPTGDVTAAKQTDKQKQTHTKIAIITITSTKT
jgi:hypothetical protein